MTDRQTEVVNSTSLDSDTEILDVVKKYSKHYKVKSRNLTPNALDLIIEINVAEDTDLIHDILKIDGVTSASILTHDGEITV